MAQGSFNLKAVCRCSELSGAKGGLCAALGLFEVLGRWDVFIGRQVIQEQVNISLEVGNNPAIGRNEAPNHIVTIVSLIQIPGIFSNLNVGHDSHCCSRSIVIVRNGLRVEAR